VTDPATGDWDGATAGTDTDAAAESSAVRAAVRAVRGGEREAFGRLVRRFQRRLFGLALMMVRDPTVAEEVAQDAFVRAYTHLDSYDERRPFYPWLATIAVRLAQNRLRRHARSVRGEGGESVGDLESGAASPFDRYATDERARELWRLVRALPSGQRTAVMLFYRDDMRVDDVARVLGVTSGTVKTLLFRARRRLREALANRTGEAGEDTP